MVRHLISRAGEVGEDGKGEGKVASRRVGRAVGEREDGVRSQTMRRQHLSRFCLCDLAKLSVYVHVSLYRPYTE